MKVYHYLVLLIFIGLYSCKKDTVVGPSENDYSKYRVKEYIKHTVSNTSDYYDTTRFNYEGDNINYTTRISTAPTIYSTHIIKSGNQYLLERFSDNLQSLEGFYSLNIAGFIDTSNFVRMNGTTNSTSRHFYNSSNQRIIDISYYENYTNDVKIHYANGNQSYWIYDFIHHTDPSRTTKDSVVFEYYNSVPLLVPFKWVLERRYGKPNENLVKKRTYYDQLNNNIIRKTYDYEYELDSNGLVSREIWRVTELPSGTVTRVDTTYYTYTTI